MKKVIIILFISIAISVSLFAVEAPGAKPKPTELILRASQVLRANGIISFERLLAVVIDETNIEKVKSDGEISPFILPLAIKNKWTIVLFIPQNIKDGHPYAVYLNKNKEPVGFISNKKIKGKHEPMAQIWRPGMIKTDDGVPIEAYQFIRRIDKKRIKKQ